MTATDNIEDAIVDAIGRAVATLAAETGPRAYTAQQVAERLGVSDETVYRLIRDGHLQKVPHLTKVRVAASELERFVEAEA